MTCTHTAAARRTREEFLTPTTDSAGRTHTLTWERTRIEGPDLRFRGVWTTSYRGVEWTVSGEYPPGAYSDDHLVWLLCARTGTRAPGELLSMARGSDVHRIGRGADTDPTSLLPGAADRILSADLA